MQPGTRAEASVDLLRKLVLRWSMLLLLLAMTFTAVVAQDQPAPKPGETHLSPSSWQTTVAAASGSPPSKQAAGQDSTMPEKAEAAARARPNGDVLGPVDAGTPAPEIEASQAAQRQKVKSTPKPAASKSKGVASQTAPPDIYPPPVTVRPSTPASGAASNLPAEPQEKNAGEDPVAAVEPSNTRSSATKASPEPVPGTAGPNTRPAGISDPAAMKSVQSYCVNIANPASDARYMRQKKSLEDLRADIQKRTSDLEVKIADFKEWMERRAEFANKAQSSLVDIYNTMKGETAAKQIVELDEETAASLLVKIDSRQSGAILGEIEPKKAARLMEIIAGASKIPKEPVALSPQGKAEKQDQTPEKSIGTQ